MTQARLLGAILAIVTLLVSSCATMSDVVKDKDKGTSVVYPVTTDQAYEIARTVFRWEGCDAIEEHKEQGYMLTSSGMNWVSNGTVMGAWVEAASEGATKVTVVTERRISIDIATTLTETTFHNRFKQAVDIVKSGQPLPALPPTRPSTDSHSPE
jgi:hypothetical protein